MAAPGAGKSAGIAAVVVVGVAAALFAFQVLRNAAVADREHRPAIAQALWPSHPSVITDNALLEVAVAAAHGRTPPHSLDADVRRIAARAPLSPDPFVIRGAIAQTQGRDGLSERLFSEARSRDPRSKAARFLLAERYFRTGRMTQGLIEMQVLVGLQSQGVEGFVPALVAYARTPGAIPQLRDFFRGRPQTEANVLTVLASDAANADLVMALANNRRDPQPDWRVPMLSQLVASGQFEKAYSAWLSMTGVRPKIGIYNPSFASERLPTPPPFNWTYAGTPEGIAESDGKGGLNVLYYGRTAATLASELMVLPPGAYRLAMKVSVSDGEPSAIRATLRCLPGDKPFAELPLRPGTVAGTVSVPESCRAARLDFGGVAGDVPQTTELRVSSLRLDAVRAP